MTEMILFLCAWYYYCIDTSGCKGTDIVIDQSNNPHIVYYATNNQLVHTWWNGTIWQRETIGAVASYHNGGPSVVIDNQNRLHIAYYSNNERLNYARYTGTSWTIEQVDTTYRTGDYCDLKLDFNGGPHIVYHRNLGWFSGFLRYARKVSGQWQIAEMSSEYGGYHPNLALDTQSNYHISDCTSWSGGDLRYIIYNGQNWQIEKPVLTNVGGSNSMVLDNQHRPQISFYYAGGGNFDLRFTNKNSGVWQVYVVDPGQQLFKRGWDNHIAIDNNQTLHIAYHCHNEGLLKYARGSGNSWNTQVVDSIGGYDSFINIALKGNDIFITYHHEYRTELWLATTRNLLSICEENTNRNNPFVCKITNGTITVPEGTEVYDISGRLLMKSNALSRITIHTTGIYLAKKDNKIFKLVVIK